MDADEVPTPGDVRREVGFALLAVVSLAIGFYRIGDPDAPIPVWVKGLDVAIGATFAADWIYRIHRAHRRGPYALRHLYEVVAFVPYTLIPQAAGGDILRGARLFRFLRFLRFGAFAKVTLGVSRLPRRLRYVGRVAHHAQLFTIALVGFLIVSAGASGLLLLEEAVNPSVRGFGQAFWWSLSLFTNVSYSIPSPQTHGGYVLSGVLVVAGIGFIGLFTASLANALLRTPEAGEEGEDGPGQDKGEK